MATDINPLESIHTIIDPERHKQEKEEKDKKPEQEEEEQEEDVLVEIHQDNEKEEHANPIDNKENPEISHEQGKGDVIDYTI
ncbi:MAG: hypothetical protein KAI81_02495 [Candidatus Marinimicrobia bacterium]|nr:hypothetical protein [Candidatus Neomarinimicrobiota bacterium]